MFNLPFAWIRVHSHQYSYNFMPDIYQKLVIDLIKSSFKSQEDILAIKRKFCKEYKIKMMNNSELLSVYREMVKSGKVKSSKKLESLLKKRQIRTLSGVAPIAVLTKPFKCPGSCLYCPNEKGMPKSYLSNEPAVMRAKICDWHPFKQVALRIHALEANGHPTDKLELIILGGTWSYLPKNYQLWFIYNCFKAANTPQQLTINPSEQLSSFSRAGNQPIRQAQGRQLTINKNFKIKNQSQTTWNDLYQEQKKNEKAKHRIVGLTLETRPDFITWQEALRMRELGCTRVEIGVQHLDDKILKLNNRGHGVAETIQATKILRSLGFKITYHMMLNLLGSDPKKDYEMFMELFRNPSFQPDQLKIYPCVVTRDSKIYKRWRQGKYKSYSDKQLKKLLEKIKLIVPYHVRIIRVIRDIPKDSIVAGNKITNLRDLLDVKCKCIRCREVGHAVYPSSPQRVKQTSKPIGLQRINSNIKLFTKEYNVNNGREIFLSYESKDKKILYAFCRLYLAKVNNKNSQTYSQTFANKLGWLLESALIRELHTYGQIVPIGDRIKLAIQHTGLGKKLIKQAEKIACQNGFKKIAVIAGIGAREYYRKFGYRLKETYIVKNF